MSTVEEHSERLTRAQNLTTDIDADLASRQTPKTVLEQMRKSALADLRAELSDLVALLGTTRHQLVFIGQVGVGKTTAICHLVGLTANRERKRTSKGVEKTVHVTERLMATGSGYTTLCEVVVVPDEVNKLEVKPYPRAEVERIISDFCVATWRKVHPDTSESGQQGEQVNFPPELVRAVRNMVRLPEGDRIENDAALRLAREFTTDGFEIFQARVLGQANLNVRVVTELTCPAEEQDPRAWIKKTCDDLNLARMETVSIPQRMTLCVDAKLLMPQMAKVAAVVDTKGVDAAQFNREDLDRYIRDEPGAICILTEAFKAAPSNVMPLLLRHITPEAPLSASKFALMVIPQSGEPEDVVGGEGPVGERERGINLRNSQIDDTLTSRGLGGFDVLFYDPLEHYERAGSTDFSLRSGSTFEEAQAERDRVWDAVFKAIQVRENKVWDRVNQIRESFQKIREGKGLNPAEEALVRQARGKIAEHRHIMLANADRFFELYRGQWEGSRERNHMTLRATNNRYGTYPPKTIDIYYGA